MRKNREKPQILNIINFVRGVEPRNQEIDLAEPVRNQLRLMKKHSLRGTFLVQYDALLREDMLDLLRQAEEIGCEIGGWLEIVQQLVEKAGMTWKGRPGFSWDWHAHAGFSVGYTPEEREKLVDVFMEDFKGIFGAYPKSVGSWLIDAHTLAYLSDKYGISASCNCRDQWGTDGYTMWGGYYNQAYYPSRNNVFTPAQSSRNQIDVPVFRMLGSDPIYEYETGRLIEDYIYTLEPVYALSGGDPKWVRWFFNEIFNGTCLTFGYAQAGQENSFGWNKMMDGITDQFVYIAELAAEGKIYVQTLGESGKWYKSNYDRTPASVTAALSDWKDEGRKSIWYCSRHYRANFFWQDSQLWIRDIHYFDEMYRERYLTDVCMENEFIYDNLPVADGNRWSVAYMRAGIRPVELDGEGNMRFLAGGDPNVLETDDEELLISWPLDNGGRLEILCKPDEMSMRFDCPKKESNLEMLLCWGKKAEFLPITGVTDKAISYMHNDFAYQMCLTKGKSSWEKAEGIVLVPENGELGVAFKRID